MNVSAVTQAVKTELVAEKAARVASEREVDGLTRRLVAAIVAKAAATAVASDLQHRLAAEQASAACLQSELATATVAVADERRAFAERCDVSWTCPSNP